MKLFLLEMKDNIYFSIIFYLLSTFRGSVYNTTIYAFLFCCVLWIFLSYVFFWILFFIVVLFCIIIFISIIIFRTDLVTINLNKINSYMEKNGSILYTAHISSTFTKKFLENLRKYFLDTTCCVIP